MSYQGLIAELPIGHRGLTGNTNNSQLGPDQLKVARNITFESGTIQKEGGAEKYNSTAISGSPAIIGGHDWHPSSAIQRMVVLASDGKLYKDSGGGTFGTTLKSGLTVASVNPVFIDAGQEAAGNDKKLLIFTGSNQVQALAADGATTADISTPAADWGSAFPSFGANHGGRIFGGGNTNDPHRLYYTPTTDHEDFTAGSLSIFPGEGEGIKAAVSFRGLLVVFKAPKGIYLVDTTDGTPGNWTIKRLNKGLGAVSPNAIVDVIDDIMFMSPVGGIHLLSAVREFGDLMSSDITATAEMAPYLRKEVNLGELANVRSVFYEAKKEVHFGVPSLNSTQNDLRLVVDMNRPSTYRFRDSNRDMVESMWLKEDSDGILRLICADDAGFVWELDQETRSKDGVGYAGEFQIPDIDLSHLDPKFATMRKSGMFLEVVVEPSGNWDLTCDILWDGEIKDTVTFNLGTTGVGLGTFELDTDALGTQQTVNRKRRIVGSGRRFGLIARNSVDGQDFSIARFFLHFKPSDERIAA